MPPQNLAFSGSNSPESAQLFVGDAVGGGEGQTRVKEASCGGLRPLGSRKEAERARMNSSEFRFLGVRVYVKRDGGVLP
jgi:hypothetical protein